MITLYVEASYCARTGAAGWGACVEGTGQLDGVALGGALYGDHPGVTRAELGAVAAAFDGAITRNCISQGQEVTIALRSTAAMAVLRWVFPSARFEGLIDVQPPGALKRDVRESEDLENLHDDVERIGVNIHLRHVGETLETLEAQHMARIHMESVRSQPRMNR